MTMQPFNFTDKGPGTVEAIEAAGIRVVQHSRHGWLCSDPAAAEAIIAAFDPVPALKTKLIEAIKAEAERRILAIVPEWKQRNLLAQAALLNDKGRGQWTAQELATWNAGQSLWARVAAIRAASDLIEADIAAIADWQSLSVFNVAESVRWPL